MNTPELRLIEATGAVTLSLWINAQGEVVDVEIQRMTVPELVAKSAEDTFRRLRFSPGEINGRPVNSVMKIEVNYGDGEFSAP